MARSQKKPLRPRVMVTVSEETFELLQQIAQEGDVAVGSLCGELLDEAKPALVAMLTAIKQAKEQSADAFDTIAKLMLDATSQANQVQMEIIEERQRLRRRPSDPDSGNENG